MKMDIKKLQAECRVLKDLLNKYRRALPEVSKCIDLLEPIFKEILSGNIKRQYKRIPCGYYFHEGELRNYPELEEAYSKFAFTAEGGDDNDLNEIEQGLL